EDAFHALTCYGGPLALAAAPAALSPTSGRPPPGATGKNGGPKRPDQETGRAAPQPPPPLRGTLPARSWNPAHRALGRACRPAGPRWGCVQGGQGGRAGGPPQLAGGPLQVCAGRVSCTTTRSQDGHAVPGAPCPAVRPPPVTARAPPSSTPGWPASTPAT